MNDSRPSDVISDNLSAMRHAHEAVVIALKSDEYNGEEITPKELKKLPQVIIALKESLKLVSFSDNAVGNAYNACMTGKGW